MKAILGTKNYWSEELSIRLDKAEQAFYALVNFLKFKTISRKSNVRFYVTILRLTVTNYCKALTTIRQIKY